MSDAEKKDAEKKDSEGKDKKATKKKSTLSLSGRTSGTSSGGSSAGGFSGGSSRGVTVEVKRRRANRPGSGTSGQSGGNQRIDARRLEALRSRAEDKDKEEKTTWHKPVAPKVEEKSPADEKSSDQPVSKDDARARELAELQEIEKEEQAKSDEAEALRKAEEEKRQEERQRRLALRGTTPQPAPSREDDDGDSRRQSRRGGGNNNRRGGGKITVSQALSGSASRERHRSQASMRRAREKNRLAGQQQEKVKISREAVIPEFITVQELANRMSERGADVIKVLMKMGMMVTITQSIDADTAELIAEEMGHTVKRVSEADVETGLGGAEDKPEELKTRPPVVTIMGHVDHGKTSLLDAMRNADVVGGEAGGITQHIGAYQVTTKDKQKVTFIDTPGHAAFTEMRARGANTTDIVILVVAADDSVMPQTIEAINHAKAAEVPIIVALNKIDLPAANPMKVKQELLQHEVIVEEMGGEIMCVEVSAKNKTNLDKLLEAILLQAEVMELKANPDRPGQGAVVEARLEQGRGNVATVLVQRGTLRVGDIVVAGTQWGKTRALTDDKQKRLKQAGPAMPVEILGLSGTPQAGDRFVVVKTEAKAREVTDYRIRKEKDAQAAKLAKGSVEDMFANIKAGEKKRLPVIIKGDVHGSVEAIQASFEKLTEDNEDVVVQALHTGVGAINESDITLAAATNALVIGFNVRANSQARDVAKRDGVQINYYSIIYNAIDDVKALLSGLLSPVEKENFIGYAEIREVFNVTKFGKIAGCFVTEGKIKRGAKVRLLRDDVVIHEGSLKTLRRFKDDVKEVEKNYECGAAFENYEDIKVGDVIEAFEIEEIAQTL